MSFICRSIARYSYNLEAYETTHKKTHQIATKTKQMKKKNTRRRVTTANDDSEPTRARDKNENDDGSIPT